MKVGYISKVQDVQNVGGVEYHRLLKPLSMLDVEVTQIIGVHQDVLDMGLDVLIFSRQLPTTQQRKFIKDLQDRGVWVICDIDDYWHLYRGHILNDMWKRNKITSRTIEALSLVDEVWVTHEHLGKAVDNINPNWYVMENALDPNDKQWRPKKEYKNRIGWAGGVTHYHDLKQVTFNNEPIICGYVDNDEGWNKIASLNPNATYVKASNCFNYGHAYELFDIAIAPLQRNKFNTYKSNLKILEAGIKGLPIFVENIHPYVDECEGIIKVDDWNKAIKQAESLSSEDVSFLGKKLRTFVLDKYDLNKVNQKRIDRL